MTIRLKNDRHFRPVKVITMRGQMVVVRKQDDEVIEVLRGDLTETRKGEIERAIKKAQEAE